MSTTQAAAGAPQRATDSTSARALSLLRMLLFNGTIVAAAIAIYYFAVLSRQQSFQTERAFRALGEVATQVDNKLATIDALFLSFPQLASDRKLPSGADIRALQKPDEKNGRTSAAAGDPFKQELDDYSRSLDIRGLSATYVSRPQPASTKKGTDSQDCIGDDRPFVCMLRAAGVDQTSFLLAGSQAQPQLRAFPMAVLSKSGALPRSADVRFTLPLQNLLDAAQRVDEFDTVLIATPQGEVLSALQHRNGRLGATRQVQKELIDPVSTRQIHDLLVEAQRQLWQGSGVSAAPSGDAALPGSVLQSRFEAPPGFSVPFSLKLEGRRYEVYVRPYRPAFPLYRPPLDKSSGATLCPQQQKSDASTNVCYDELPGLFIVGLKPQNLSASAAADLGASANWYLLLGVLAAIALLPLLRLLFLERHDAIGRLHLRAVRGALMLLVALLTIAVLSLAAAHSLQAWADRGAKNYADDLAERLRRDMAAAVRTLPAVADWYAQPSKTLTLPLVNKHGNPTSDDKPVVVPLSACDQSVATTRLDPREPDKRQYYQLQAGSAADTLALLNQVSINTAFMLDASGKMPGTALTLYNCVHAPASFDLSSREYFSVLRDGGGWDAAALQTGDPRIQRYVAQRLFNKVDGSKRLQLAIPHANDQGVFDGITSVDSPMYAFSAAIQPLAYRYAIVDEDSGTVIFHSDDRRSLVENFMVEAEHMPGLVGAMAARSEGSFEGSYYGVRHRIHYQPLPFAPWGVIVLYPADTIGKLLFYGGLIALTAYIALMLTTLLLVAAVLIPWRARLSWLYPQWRLRRSYPVMIVFLLAALLVQCAFVWRLQGFVLALALMISVLGSIAAAHALLGGASPHGLRLRLWRFAVAMLVPLAELLLWLLAATPGSGLAYVSCCVVVVLALLLRILILATALRCVCQQHATKCDGWQYDSWLRPELLWPQRSRAVASKVAGKNDAEQAQATSKNDEPSGGDSVRLAKLGYFAVLGLMVVQIAVIPPAGLMLRALNVQIDAALRAGLLDGASSFGDRVAAIDADLHRQLPSALMRKNSFPDAEALARHAGAPGFVLNPSTCEQAVATTLQLTVFDEPEATRSKRQPDPMLVWLWSRLAQFNNEQALRWQLVQQDVQTKEECDLELPTAAPGVTRHHSLLSLAAPLSGAGERIRFTIWLPLRGDAYVLADAASAGQRGTLIHHLYREGYFLLLVLAFVFALLLLLRIFAKRLMGLDLLSSGLGEEEYDAQPRAWPLLLVGAAEYDELPQREQRKYTKLQTPQQQINLAADDLATVRLDADGDALLLTHLDAAVLDPARRPLVLKLLQQALQRRVETLYVMTLVDPLHRLANPELYPHPERATITEDELAGWAEVQARFSKDYVYSCAAPTVVGETDLGSWPEFLRGGLAAAFRDTCRKQLLQDYNQRECSGLPERVGTAVCQALQALIDKGAVRSKEHVQHYLLAHARPQLLRSWISCTVNERLALFHLAQGRHLNPLNEDVIKQLHRKGLIDLRPEPQLASDTLRRFVLGAETPELFSQWTQDAQIGIWQSLRTPLFVVLALLVAWMAYSAGDVFQAFSAVLAGTLGFLGTALRAASLVRGGSPDAGK